LVTALQRLPRRIAALSPPQLNAAAPAHGEAAQAEDGFLSRLWSVGNAMPSRSPIAVPLLSHRRTLQLRIV
jgi:hypothetical protein